MGKGGVLSALAKRKAKSSFSCCTTPVSGSSDQSGVKYVNALGLGFKV